MLRKHKLSFAMLSLAFTFFVLATKAVSAYTIGGFGRLEGLYTGFFQVMLPIGIIIAVALLVYKVFLPGAMRFLGGIFG